MLDVSATRPSNPIVALGGLLLGLWLVAAAPGLAQDHLAPVPTPTPTPFPTDPDPDDCPDPQLPCLPDAEPLTFGPPGSPGLQQTSDQAVTTYSPMVFYAVGDGLATGGGSMIYRFGLQGSVVNVTALKQTTVPLWDVAIDPAGSPHGPLYLVDGNRNFYSYHPLTGAFSWIGRTQHELNSLEFCGGQLFGWGDHQYIVTIDPATGGTLTSRNRAASRASGDLMCSPGGSLYGIAAGSTADYLVAINKTFGYTTWVGSNLPGQGFFGGEFDGIGQLIVGRKAGSSVVLYRINTTTWQADITGSFSTNYGLNGLTTYPAVW